MTHSLGIRQAQKQKTHRALLEAGLLLMKDQSLSSVSLREVTRVVGVVPASFYRHFHDMADLGVALVEECLGRLHVMVRALLAERRRDEGRIDGTVDAVLRHVRAYPAHVRFIARERYGGVQAVREAIAEELRGVADEVAAAFASELAPDGWREDDVRMFAELYVDHMVLTATALLETPPGSEAERQVVDTAHRQLRLITLGRRHWRDRG
ncbi:TetR family transcriptional regulator [Streptomyces sp. B1866]|uniref:TetR family transcriptional regulator n=1 Tax=Streptomyces sp. B1866 TaxID=3075431 RepID=UPI00288DE805|nr:TetR family transcriptional regulator [Streptomyces sp. B1866]MDT3398502.1 TetR family transcriptional regulator [Streptomyces sp. B1866]